MIEFLTTLIVACFETLTRSNSQADSVLLASLIGAVGGPLLVLFAAFVYFLLRAIWRRGPITIGEPCLDGDMWVAPVTSRSLRQRALKAVLRVSGAETIAPWGQMLGVWEDRSLNGVVIRRGERRQLIVVRIEKTGNCLRRYIPYYFNGEISSLRCSDWESSDDELTDLMKVLAYPIKIEVTLETTPPVRGGLISQVFSLEGSRLVLGYLPPGANSAAWPS